LNGALLLACTLLATGTGSERSLLRELDTLERALATSDRHVAALDGEAQKLAEELATLEAERAAAQVRRDEALERYSLRVRALARMPAGARLLLLSGLQSLGDFLRTNRVLRWVAEHDRKVHTALVGETARLDTLVNGLAVRQARLTALADETRRERDAAAAQRNDRLTLVREALADRAHLGREHNAARAALVTMLERVERKGPQSAAFVANRGRLPWPAPGPLGTRFGQQIDVAFGTETTHSGIDIRAAAGTPVQAVAVGVVVYADWLPGFGQVVIIDHGDDYHSVSAHLSTMSVTLGGEVAAGTLVGTVGDSGSLRGPLLYFEIRHGGIAEDPLLWLRR